MSLIWILLAVVYAKSNEVVDREERVPTLHNSTSEQNQSISYTAPSEINKYGVVKPAIKYFTSSVVCNENLTLQENVHRFDSNPLNSTDTSGRHFNHTTLPKLSKSNKSIYDFYFSYDLDVVQDLFNGISTSRLIPKNEKFMPNQQKYNSSMSSNGDGTVDERLKNRSFEILKTEVGVNKSQEIDEASNFFQNIQTVSTIPVRLRKDTDSLENTSKNKVRNIYYINI